MLTISCLIYATLLCFVWSDKANDYVDAYWVGCLVCVFAHACMRLLSFVCACGGYLHVANMNIQEVLDFVLDKSVVDPADLKTMMQKCAFLLSCILVCGGWGVCKHHSLSVTTVERGYSSRAMLASSLLPGCLCAHVIIVASLAFTVL